MSLQQEAQPQGWQKKYLNMVVPKQIGDIASGKQRRENRNKMIAKNQGMAKTGGALTNNQPLVQTHMTNPISEDNK